MSLHDLHNNLTLPSLLLSHLAIPIMQNDEGTYTCKLSNLAGDSLGGEFTVGLKKPE